MTDIDLRNVVGGYYERSASDGEPLPNQRVFFKKGSPRIGPACEAFNKNVPDYDKNEMVYFRGFACPTE